MFYCGTDNCDLRYIEMPKKAVEDFAESYQDRLNDCKRIGNLNEELIRTRKALDVARHTIGWINQMIDEHTDKQAIKIKCEYALQQITALEQKE